VSTPTEEDTEVAYRDYNYLKAQGIVNSRPASTQPQPQGSETMPKSKPNVVASEDVRPGLDAEATSPQAETLHEEALDTEESHEEALDAEEKEFRKMRRDLPGVKGCRGGDHHDLGGQGASEKRVLQDAPRSELQTGRAAC
jgi:hypothetical protein